jgi:hypothetical protein
MTLITYIRRAVERTPWDEWVIKRDPSKVVCRIIMFVAVAYFIGLWAGR